MVLLLLIINEATTVSDLVSKFCRIIQGYGKVGIINQNTEKYKKKITFCFFGKILRDAQDDDFTCSVKSSLVHRVKEVPVCFVLFELFEQELHALHGGERIQDLSQNPHAVQIVLVHEQ